MEKFKFSNIIKCILFCICIIRSECFTLLNSPAYIVEQGDKYCSVQPPSQNISKDAAYLVYDPLNPECFYEIFKYQNIDNVKNFLNAILYPSDTSNPNNNKLQIDKISGCDYYTNTPGKPIIYKCTLNNNDKTNFEVVLSVIKDSSIGRMVKYYQRINDRKSSSDPIKYITFCTKNNSTEDGEIVGIFKSDLTLARSSISKIDNVLDEIIINTNNISKKITAANSLIKINSRSENLKKEGLEWLKFLTIASFQSGIKNSQYVIPTNDLTKNVQNAVDAISKLNTYPSITEWYDELFAPEYSLISDIHNTILQKKENKLTSLKDQIKELLEAKKDDDTPEVQIACVENSIKDIKASMENIIPNAANKITDAAGNISTSANKITDAAGNIKDDANKITAAVGSISTSAGNINTKLTDLQNFINMQIDIKTKIESISSLVNTINESLYGIEIDENGVIKPATNTTVTQRIEALKSITLGVSETVTKLHSLLSKFPTATLIAENQELLTTEINKINYLISNFTTIDLKSLTDTLTNTLNIISERVKALSNIMTDLSTTNIATMGINIGEIQTDVKSTKTSLTTLSETISSIHTQTLNTASINQKIDSVSKTSSDTLTNIQSANTTLNSLSDSENKILNLIQVMNTKLSSGTSSSSGNTDISPIITLIEDIPTKKDFSSSQNELIAKMNTILAKIESSGSSSEKPEETPTKDNSYSELKPYLEKLPFKTYDTEYELKSVLKNNPQLIFYVTAKLITLNPLIAFGDNFHEALVMVSNQYKKSGTQNACPYIRRNRAMVFYNAFLDEFQNVFNNIQKNCYITSIKDIKAMMLSKLISMITNCTNTSDAITILPNFWVKQINFEDLKDSYYSYTPEKWDTVDNAKLNLQQRSYDNINTSTNIKNKSDVTNDSVKELQNNFNALLSYSPYLLFYLWAKYITAPIETYTVDTKSSVDANYTFSEYYTMSNSSSYVKITNSDYTLCNKHVLLNRLYVIKKSGLDETFANGALTDYNLEVLKRFISSQSKLDYNINSFLQYDTILKMSTSDYWTQKYHKDLYNIKS